MSTLSKYVDTEEFVYNTRTKRRRRGLVTRSSAEGVLIRQMPQRMLGYQQVYAMARALMNAAKYAKDRGAPQSLVSA